MVILKPCKRIGVLHFERDLKREAGGVEWICRLLHFVPWIDFPYLFSGPPEARTGEYPSDVVHSAKLKHGDKFLYNNLPKKSLIQIAQDADEARELAELQALYKSQQEEVEELRDD